MTSGVAHPSSPDSAAHCADGPLASPRHMLWRVIGALVAVALLQITFFGYIARHRFVDGDEGFFLLASRLVLSGKKPYLDFLYEQGPLLPYVYAGWMKAFGITWASARFFAAILTSLLGVLLCREVRRQTQSWLAAAAALVMFSLSMLVFGFFPVAKTYSLAALCLFFCYALLTSSGAASSRWTMLAAGLLFGLSVDTRAYLLLLAPVFVWWIVARIESCNPRTATLWFLGGLVLGNAPAIWLFLASPSAFLFNNLGFHAVRSHGGLVGNWQQKLVALLVTFLGGGQSNGLQMSLLFFASVICLSLAKRRSPAPQLAFLIAVVLGVISLLPTPVHPQYFCLCVPFLIVSAVCGATEVISELEGRRTKLLATTGCWILVSICAAAATSDLRRYLVTGQGVPGVALSRENTDWKLEQVLAVSLAVDEVAQPGEAVASFWPGYVVQSHAVSFPGFEADYGLLIADKLTAEQRSRYHILSGPEIDGDFAAHRPRVVVLRDELPMRGAERLQNLLRTENALRRSLLDHGYVVARSLAGVSIYIYSPKQ